MSEKIGVFFTFFCIFYHLTVIWYIAFTYKHPVHTFDKSVNSRLQMNVFYLNIRQRAVHNMNTIAYEYRTENMNMYIKWCTSIFKIHINYSHVKYWISTKVLLYTLILLHTLYYIRICTKLYSIYTNVSCIADTHMYYTKVKYQTYTQDV